MIRKTTVIVTLLSASVLGQGEGVESSIDATKASVAKDFDAAEGAVAQLEVGTKIQKKQEKIEDLKWAYKDALADTSPITWIGATSVLGAVTWMWTLFFYAKTGQTDTTMAGVPPIAWFWSNLGNTSLGFTAASYFCFFFGYLIVFVPELFLWLQAESGGDPQPLAWWAYYFGTWVSVVMNALPWLFAFIQLFSPTLLTGTSYGYANAVTLTVIGMVVWVWTFVVHFIFVPRYALHAKALVISECLCPKADLAQFPDNVKSHMEKSYVKACENKLQKPQCKKRLRNAVVENCTIERQAGENDYTYTGRCLAATSCSLDRADGVSDFDYLIQCRATQMVTNLSEAKEEEEDDSEPLAPEGEDGNDWE